MRAEQMGRRILFPLVVGVAFACTGPSGERAPRPESLTGALDGVAVDEVRIETMALAIEDELAEVESGGARRVRRSEALDREVARLAASDMDMSELRATAAALRARTYASAGADELPTGDFVPTDEDRRLAARVDPEIARMRAPHPVPTPDLLTPSTEGVASAPPVLGEACTAEASHAR